MSRFKDWLEDGTPPIHWPRLLAFDVGGASANELLWAAQDPESHSLVFYHELNKVTTDMRLLAEEAKPYMKPPGGKEEYNFISKVGDYENRVALDDMSKHGITFTNAVKHNKTLSIHRLSGYLHPNPKRPFPAWHPSVGQLGAPLMYITPGCPQLISEIPQQKWKSQKSGQSVKDELDRSVRHDAVDCALYIARILPAPATIPIPKMFVSEKTKSLQSQLYWEDVKRQQERKSETVTRRPYNPNHGAGGGHWGVR